MQAQLVDFGLDPVLQLIIRLAAAHKPQHTIRALAMHFSENIDEENIVEFFGAVEHPIPYTDCSHHHFHVPVYSKIVIRDPDTLEPIGMEKTGLVNLISPLCKATPILSVMTDDLGILHDGSNCPCGVKSPYLEIVGRVAPDDIKTCAAGAADILKGVKV